MEVGLFGRLFIGAFCVAVARCGAYVVAQSLHVGRTCFCFFYSDARASDHGVSGQRSIGCAMGWIILQLAVFIAVMVSNIEWRWTPNGYLASGVAIGAAYLATRAVSRLLDRRAR
jgi:hypothetical protein